MQHFKVGDGVLVINATYEPRIIGHVGTVGRAADLVSGVDRFGCVVCGEFVVVDLPGDVNRHGTTLWYLKPEYLIKLDPDVEVEQWADRGKLDARSQNGPRTVAERLPG